MTKMDIINSLEYNEFIIISQIDDILDTLSDDLKEEHYKILQALDNELEEDLCRVVYFKVNDYFYILLRNIEKGSQRSLKMIVSKNPQILSTIMSELFDEKTYEEHFAQITKE